MFQWLEEELRQHYEKVECLRQREDCCIDLLRHRDFGRLLICRRFKGDAAAYRRLLGVDSPMLPRIYEVAEQDGQALVLEEYIEGISLAQLLEQTSLEPQQARRLGACLCDGLWTLHSLDIVHRDVKPQNVLLGREGRPCLIDFDAARLHKPQQGNDTVVLGTTGFAAPEQYGLGQTDARSDIYALGVLLNLAVTGRHPAQALCPGRLGEIVARCTQTSPQQRYQDVLQLKADLLDGLEDADATATQLPSVSRPAPAKTRQRLCPHCGEALTNAADFCPACMQPLLAVRQAGPPAPLSRPGSRRRLLLVAVAALLLLAALAWGLRPGNDYQPQQFVSNNNSITYQDETGSYTLYLHRYRDVEPRERLLETGYLAQEALGTSWILPLGLSVFDDAGQVASSAFAAQLVQRELELQPLGDTDGQCVWLQDEFNEHGYDDNVFTDGINYTAYDGGYLLKYKLTMSNGDAIILHWLLEIEGLTVVDVYNHEGEISSTENLNQLLADGEMYGQARVIVHLPPLSYGELVMETDAFDLVGSEEGRSVIAGLSLAPGLDEVSVDNIDFIGQGGEGLVSAAPLQLSNCSFSGYDAALSINHEQTRVEGCRFSNNGEDIRDDSNGKAKIVNCVFE